jgi:hypothetical protein
MTEHDISTVRRATVDDLEGIVQLIRRGDERDYDPEDVAQYIQRLNPAYSQAWMAVVGRRPVGMTMTFQRMLQASKRQYTARYWVNLFIDPEYRHLMLYPRLLKLKFSELKRDGIDFLYTMVRRPKLIEAHVRVGFTKIADVMVMVKPLRPGRLVIKYSTLPQPLAIFTWPVDWLFSGYMRVRRPHIPSDLSIDEVSWDSPDVDDIAEILRDSCANRIGQVWSSDAIRRRFTCSLDGVPYFLLVSRREGQLVAATVYRTVDRDRGIRMGVVMDLVFRDKEELAAQAVLAEAQRRSYAAGADGMMCLDGSGPGMQKLLAADGYVRSSERYSLLLWPKTKLSSEPLLYDISYWRLAFSDHDAF